MFGELLLTGARYGVAAFAGVAVFLSLAAMLFLIIYTILIATDREGKNNNKR